MLGLSWSCSFPVMVLITNLHVSTEVSNPGSSVPNCNFFQNALSKLVDGRVVQFGKLSAAERHQSHLSLPDQFQDLAAHHLARRTDNLTDVPVRTPNLTATLFRTLVSVRPVSWRA
jgi:hypothetical protein